MSIQSKGYVRTWFRLQTSGKRIRGEGPALENIQSRYLFMYHLHRTQTSRTSLNATTAVTPNGHGCHLIRLPLSHRGAWEYPLDPAYPSTTLMYEVTTLMPLGLPPIGWPSKALEQARKHNEPLSNPQTSGLTILVTRLMININMD